RQHRNQGTGLGLGGRPRCEDRSAHHRWPRPAENPAGHPKRSALPASREGRPQRPQQPARRPDCRGLHRSSRAPRRAHPRASPRTRQTASRRPSLGNVVQGLTTMAKKSKAAYMISAVAEQYAIHPQTLRLYEREGLLKPSRSDGNTRLYTPEDIERLEV